MATRVIPNYEGMVTPKFIAIHVFVFKMHTFKLFKKNNHRNIFSFRIPLELASAKPFFHTNTKNHGNAKGNAKGYVFQKQAQRQHIFIFYFHFYLVEDYICKT